MGINHDKISYREECYKCFRAKINCLCDEIKPFFTNMRFVILMHFKEARREKTGTARLAQLSLLNSEILIGDDFSDHKRVNALIQDADYYPVVLFPGPDSLNFKLIKNNGINLENKKILVFVIDGTWTCARKIFRRSKNLHGLPKMSFLFRYASQFKIKRQPREDYISTIEAIYYLCKEAEAEGFEELENHQESLMLLFKRLVDNQLHYADWPDIPA